MEFIIFSGINPESGVGSVPLDAKAIHEELFARTKEDFYEMEKASRQSLVDGQTTFLD